MATLNMNSSMTVGELKKQFREAFGSSLRVYKGGRVADDTLALSEIGLKADGTLECRSSLTVAGFISRMMNDHGLKVKVYTCDEWVACLDGLTLESTGKVKKNAVKTDMESMIAYQRQDKEESVDDEDEEDFEECEVPIGECVVDNVTYDIYSDCAFAQYLENEEVTSVAIPDYVEFEGKQYPVTYWGAGSETVKTLELGANVKDVDSLHAYSENIVEIIVHSPQGYIVAEDDEGEETTLEKCYPKATIKYVSQQEDKDALSGYKIVAEDNGGYSVYKNGTLCENAKGAMREIAALIGFGIDPNWTTRQLGAKLLKAMNSEEKEEATAFPMTNDKIIAEAKKSADVAIEEAKSKKGLLGRIIDKIIG